MGCQTARPRFHLPEAGPNLHLAWEVCHPSCSSFRQRLAVVEQLDLWSFPDVELQVLVVVERRPGCSRLPLAERRSIQERRHRRRHP